MNYYDQTKDYYSYVNNNYNQPVYEQKKEQTTLFDPYAGFIRGNMFQDLYNPYKVNKPIEVTPANEQADLLTYIDALGFAMIDLNLYLDVNPNDQNMIKLYNQYRVKKEEVMKEYQNKFGPLLLNSEALIKTPWAWDNSPWPWEGK